MDDLQWMYRHVVVDGLAAGEGEPFVVIVVPPEASAAQRAGDAAEQIDALFERYSSLSAVTVYVEGILIGTATREQSGATDPDQGVHGPSSWYRNSGGDRTILPGQSRRYEVLRYTCPRCARGLYTVAPTPPECPVCHLNGRPAP
jgi:hypothetical protein